MYYYQFFDFDQCYEAILFQIILHYTIILPPFKTSI
jgi:hypothetical protein